MKAAISVAAVLLGIFLYLFAAAKLPLQRTNEAMYAVPPVRMLQTGDYLVPRYENRDFLEKPPLSWWVIAASYRLLGVTPFAERLPSVLAAFATILLTGLWVRRRSGDEAGVFAALILMFTLQFSVYARTFAADSFLALAVVLAAAALDDACRREGSGARRGILAGAALALAFGIKGLVGIVLPAGGVAAGLLIDRQRPIRPVARGAWAFAALLVLVAPWHLAMTHRLGAEFWRFFYWDNQFLRGATKLYMGTSRSPLFYLGAIAWAAFPWSLLLASVVRRRASTERRRSSLPLGLFLFGLAFFSLLVMKREVYLMPLFPAAAVLLAEGAAEVRAPVSAWRRIPWLLAATLLAVLLVFWARGLTGLASLVGSGRALPVGAGLLALVLALAAGGVARRPATMIPAVALACGILFLALAFCEEKLERREALPRFGELVRSQCSGANGCDGFLVGLEAYSLDFYSGVEWRWVADPSRDVPRLAKNRKVFLVMWSELDVMLRDLPWPWRVVAKGDVLSSQWAVDALGVRKESPFRSLSLVEITPGR